jgi:UDP-N-acetyl-D-glucosamine dehydrogenase
MKVATELLQLIESREARVGIVGLGYVGLPLALTFAERGFPVLGFDTDRAKTARIEAGSSYIEHISAARIRDAAAEGRLVATGDFSRLAEVDAVIICVPTPLTASREPDLSFVLATAREIGRTLRPGQLVVLESTTYPGTTDELLLPLLEESGLVCGEQFFLAYSPEREDPGNPKFTTSSIPKVVGGSDPASRDLAIALYEQIVVEAIAVSSPAVAEATKLTENVFRAVNIALVNELKMVFDRMGIDVWEVLDAASTKPFGFMRFEPGPGWGGHCIPIDPFYLAWKARQHDTQARFIELAGEVNVQMPRWVVGKLAAALRERAMPLADARVLLLGIAYKPDVADPRESPAFELMSLLQAEGAKISFHDPLLPEMPAMRRWRDLEPPAAVPLDAETLAAHDATVVVTHHSAVDYDLVRRHAPLIVDTRGVYRDTSSPSIVRS